MRIADGLGVKTHFFKNWMYYMTVGVLELPLYKPKKTPYTPIGPSTKDAPRMSD